MTTYPLAASTWGDEERQAAIDVLDSGQTTMGPKVREFEERFAEYFGARYAVMSNSGSSANLLAVAALFFTREPKVKAGMTAIVPAVSWATTYYPLTQYGLKLRFVDIDADTLNFDLKALAEAIDDDVAVIFAVNLLGNPNDYTAIKALIGDRPITLLEDNCESMGATFGGRATGTFGAIGTYSTFFSHHMSTMEGGVSVTDDEELYQLMLSLRAHGWTRNLSWPNHLVEKDERSEFYELFRFILPGYNLRPLEMSGAIGIEQLKRLPGFIEQRRANAARFQELFSDVKGLRIQQETGQSSWFGFSLVLTPDAAVSRETVLAALKGEGVETRPVVAGNFYRNPVIRHLDYHPNPNLPNADEIHDRGFYIGNHHWDVRPDLERLRQIVGQAISG
ncbi:DegT/DnrJ/EryC1/StrS family aminotransferase [Brevundimonas sp.]|uniref:DegT/DnrJ/EryC1/StrS family aminotransferase n=1 Tax=Brevundimonas sp. TaxID=1871086 RepID=UPI002C4A5EA8|nr:DegT/DnrJ/EryC1/StrS family aminotransferase [Brevundimonas sp.]HWQ88268.1 DegT/DnrJ/EryC1/StrS family aminotransferase [Brevundimonas sp.]